jgi:cell wall-associated NlpC family hydrolase
MKTQTTIFFIFLLANLSICTIINSVKGTMNLDINFDQQQPQASCLIQTEMKSKNKVRSLITNNQNAETAQPTEPAATTTTTTTTTSTAEPATTTPTEPATATTAESNTAGPQFPAEDDDEDVTTVPASDVTVETTVTAKPEDDKNSGTMSSYSKMVLSGVLLALF